MAENSVGEYHLEQLSQLAFDSIERRRIGLFHLLEFYTAVLDTAGERMGYGIYNTDFNDPTQIDKSWNNTLKPRFRRVEEISIPPEFEGTLAKIVGRRDDAFHNLNTGVSKGKLEQWVDEAPQWREWLLEAVSTYNSVNPDEGEMLRRILRESLFEIIEADLQDFDEEHTDKVIELQRKAKNEIENLEDIDVESLDLDPEITETLRSIIDLRVEHSYCESMSQMELQVSETWEE